MDQASSGSSRCLCTWQISLNNSKKINKGNPERLRFQITTINLQHCSHQMISPDLRFLSMSAEMNAFIENAVVKHHLPYRQIRINLQKEFPHFEFDQLAVKSQVRCHVRREKQKGPVIPEAVRLFSLLLGERDKDPGFMFIYNLDEEQRLTRLFWMSSIQQQLYQQFSDVLVIDITFSTNRFEMPLHQMVVVDSNFKTRLVANAMTAGESQDECRWVLEQLLQTTGNTAPNVVILDKDPSMIAACNVVIPATRLVHCLWHREGNVKKNLRGPLGELWSPFKASFLAASHSIDEAEFKIRWHTLCSTYASKDGPVKDYLQRLYDDRHHWVWAWIKTIFTAGMQSTQRVEVEHNLVKILGPNSKSTLTDVVQATTVRVRQEFYSSVYTEDEEGKNAKKMANRVQDLSALSLVFGRILDMNSANLDQFARSRMESQMYWALVYSCTEITLETMVKR
jgi:hypothetical protein